ncbi:hypothetical protein PGT21_006694 [Puccinia graminis f. sp. tritici]|uniref:Uncharacterized protein n=1 Tax=Puccinia graminis f. sp. tritici TaxID=56615 RepID=A0A5B0LZI2_PUCGR|nr:hypothetical protein PGT21_006694 [Puccinia graminis f. sp. tritici]
MEDEGVAPLRRPVSSPSHEQPSVLKASCTNSSLDTEQRRNWPLKTSTGSWQHSVTARNRNWHRALHPPVYPNSQASKHKDPSFLSQFDGLGGAAWPAGLDQLTS